MTDSGFKADVPVLAWSNRLIPVPIVYSAGLLGWYRCCGRDGKSMSIRAT